ncbi:glycerol-3-phosphate-1-acyltransferase [Mycena belliarum]|uniref:Glycerol-3-phosphate-1-acyltransferase n=1 Tax=Mycena belliarum TaxID=1033014 RepID=A0AAD6UN54_9AGAR|nr:glycerol-3-phosphate-1-acyltransferase [Mycena belliae]
MELRLVYRLLRQASDWALVSFYSEAYVSGEYNVPQDAPLVITPCHHNELIDVATLAATIPYRRKVSFWAKSTTFSHPVLGPILSSSGAIPVRRNPNKADAAASNAALFDASTTALSRRQVIGVFPEGTSYTEPAVTQILSGAAWAALEFMRSQHTTGNTQSVVIIPVGIVYTNKSKFRSRVHIEYGYPIDMASYVSPSMFAAVDVDAERLVVKAVMQDVETQLKKMTINGPDWETIYAARMARDILWEDERNVKLKDWVFVNQTLVNLFSPSVFSENAEITSVKCALTKYFSLLQYAKITNAHLAFLLPDTAKLPSRLFVFHFLFAVLRTLLNPSFLLFIPPFIAHIPAYLLAGLGSKYLAPAGEEESQAQFKVILGGLGTGIGAGLSSYWVTRLASVSNSRLLNGGGARSKLFLWSFIACILIKWHGILVDKNYRRFERLSAAYKVLVGVLQPRSWDLPFSKLALYEAPPTPAGNAFLPRKEGSAALGGSAWLKAQPPHVPSRKLISHLLFARQSAIAALAVFRKTWADEKVLRDLGGVFPT